GLNGVYGGYNDWRQRAGRFRSLGDGQGDFKQVFTLLTEHGYDGWAFMEWECCIKSPEQGAAEGAPFIRSHLIESATYAFDEIAKSANDREKNRKILGIKYRMELEINIGVIGTQFMGRAHSNGRRRNREFFSV